MGGAPWKVALPAKDRGAIKIAVSIYSGVPNRVGLAVLMLSEAYPYSSL